ncbi:MAG: outer membrane protein assembly factor BamA [Gammaproteobacteria bacterium]|nr:outer membrane protein assembly factor BamA [Gammaproteobacteria bacterium]MCB1922239.1 outer membrane protein assembly factor BamA [Gammaproteobacteria bacterium]
MQARIWVVLLLLAIGSDVLAEGFRVADIRVEGLQRITAGTVFNYLPVKPGDEIDFNRTSDIVRALYKTGFFKDVRLEKAGNVLVVVVTERPAISEIRFTGNKSIDTEKLKEGLKDIGLAEGRTFDRSVLERIEQELERQYYNQGKYAVKLTSTVTPLERNRVAIDIDVVEGETALIKSINIVGNTVFDDDDLLDEFELSTGGWLSRLTRDNQYSRPKLSGDLETLRSYYLDRGYINFKIDSTQVTITPDRKDIYITINVTEGDIYTISDVRLAGDLIGDPAEYFPLIHLRRGEPFARKAVVESSDRVSAKLSDLGYAFANVNSIPEIDEDGKSVAITLFVDPGQRAYVRRINISGNSRTRDAVVRREFRQMESGWFSGEKLKLSRERVQRTGFFESVNVETPSVPGSADEVDINVVVGEKSSGQLLAGVGFSQSDGVIFNASISEDNFAGTGKKVALALQTSAANQVYQVSYTNPYYTVDGISRGFNLSYRSTDFDELDTADYKTDDAIGSVNFGFPLSEFNRFNFGFALHHIDFETGAVPSQEVLAFEQAEGNRFLNFETTLSWRHDSRDTAIFPRAGALQSLYAEASIPGSDLQYWKVSYEHRRYWALTSDLVVSAVGEIGFGDAYGSTTALPFFENFFAGGPASIRGFAARSVGPRDSQGDSLGGNAMYAGGLELLFPPPFKQRTDTVRLALFFDFGSVVDSNTDIFEPDELRYSTGLGASWLSPLGALTVSYAIPFRADSQDEEEQFQFSLGTTF